MKTKALNEINELVKRFKLLPHPEGGHYACIFKSTDTVKSSDKERYNDEDRSAGTSIYYLLKGDDFSAWHSLKSDELWHYYTGSSVKIYVVDKQGNLTTYLLGNTLENPDALFQVAIAADNWFAAEVVDKTSYCLVGCTVNPGFEFKDFKLANRESLSAEFPQHQALINQFTRKQ
jgi:predicted cupin superfamily sugar epimerase